MRLRRFLDQGEQEETYELAHMILERADVTGTIDAAIADSTSSAGQPWSRHYTTRAVLTAQMMCLAARKLLSVPNLLQILWHLADDQLSEVGMTGQITPAERRALADDQRAYEREYHRFYRRYNQILDVMDSSPHPRMRREVNAVRRARLGALTRAEKADLARREDLFMHVIGALIQASVADARPDHYRGHVALDETWHPARATTIGAGTRMEKLGGADPDAAWRNNKKHGHSEYVHMFVFTVMAAMPYERGVPMVVTGVRPRFATGETNTDAAVAALRMHLSNGFGPGSGRVARCYADRGYTAELDFAGRLIGLNYQVSADAEQLPSKTGHKRPEGPILIGGRWCCPAARYLESHRALQPVDEAVATDHQLRVRQDIVDELEPFIMPANGKPLIYPKGHRRSGHARVRLACPASAGQVRCPLVPESLSAPKRLPFARNAPEAAPLCCRTANSSITVPTWMLKHTDVLLRGSFEHADGFNVNRSNNEKDNAYFKRSDMGAFAKDSLQMMGRARTGLAVVMAIAVTNVRTIAQTVHRHGSVHTIPHTPRLRSARLRTARIAADRRAAP